MHASDIRKRNTKRQHNVHRILIHKTNVRFKKKATFTIRLFMNCIHKHILALFFPKDLFCICVCSIFDQQHRR